MAHIASIYLSMASVFFMQMARVGKISPDHHMLKYLVCHIVTGL